MYITSRLCGLYLCNMIIILVCRVHVVSMMVLGSMVGMSLVCGQRAVSNVCLFFTHPSVLYTCQSVILIILVHQIISAWTESEWYLCTPFCTFPPVSCAVPRCFHIALVGMSIANCAHCRMYFQLKHLKRLCSSLQGISQPGCPLGLPPLQTVTP